LKHPILVADKVKATLEENGVLLVNGVNGINLPNTDDVELDVALSPLSFPSSSAMTYCVSDCLSLHHLEILTGWGGM